ncbi:MAG TPA: glycosyltransferase [Bacteroidia bacterium]|nr:glycosyltransferase [Bacteroidia bacterium]
MFKLNLAWDKEPEFISADNGNNLTASIVIPARNEENVIENILTSLLHQQTSGKWEVIVSDDFSDDNTAIVVSGYIEKFKNKGVNLHLITPGKEDGIGKKAALSRGILAASGELIITTDADCVVPERWLSTILSFQMNTNASMILLPVELAPVTNFFTGFQALEFAGLMGSGAASMFRNKPLMSNGAGLVFLKSDFVETGGYSGGDKYVSGDDTFLMFSFLQNGKKKIQFLKSRNAIVSAAPVHTLGLFIQQRIRWISKVKGYKQHTPLITGLRVSLANVSLLGLIILALSGTVDPLLPLGAFVIKSFFEFILLYHVSSFLGRRKLLLLFLPSALIVLFYFMFSLWFLLFPATFQWKNRSFKN